MENIESAYTCLAGAILSFIGESRWDAAGSSTKIYNKMTTTNYWRRFDGEVTENDRFPPLEIAGPASEASIFLRDNLLATTGDRIWGLAFTLYPNGKFNIEYDYNKPTDYEETDEVISGSEINESLSNIREDDSKG
ncbi:hypothetical protein LH452_14795 [Laribacter hongkongensis]|uniref:hypothetical protein n=1 Tax=Laribacter hongkongensis TaxID=168471 RepID=UPI001EFDB8F4|nr:hypothetical protein [Laribacter hongkongensis]MCG9060154.1 hypothetical protein [Laribacter hongkongensis]MCG9087251.1 hypothetical protein [Laribacter hongkongensis]